MDEQAMSPFSAEILNQTLRAGDACIRIRRLNPPFEDCERGGSPCSSNPFTFLEGRSSRARAHTPPSAIR